MAKDCKTVWDNCLRIIREQIGEQSFKTWFEPIVPLMLNGNVLTIQVPSQFFYEWLEEHYVHILRKAICSEIGKNGRLEYSIIVDKGNNKNRPYTVNLPTYNNYSGKNQNGQSGGYAPGNGQPSNGNSTATAHKKSTQAAAVNGNGHHANVNGHAVQGSNGKGVPQGISDSFRLDSNLNPRYTFDCFVEGDCNRLARSAGYAVADKPGITSFNPLVIYGGVGLGKTHLIQAIGNEIRNSGSDKFVLYVSSEEFTNQFIDALKNNRVQNFSNFYLNVDTLIIDDIQFLSGKEKTQEMFFHIFNHLHQAGKQVVLTSDNPPKNIKGLEERLLSRFKWGLTADLQQPDFETRMAIIQKKIQDDGLDLSHDVQEYLAYSVDTNIRELEGVMISLVAQSSLNKKEIDLELAKQTLKNIVQDIETEVGIDYIQKMVGEKFEVSLDEMKSKSRKKEIVMARQVAMYLSKEYTSMSLKAIGYHFGNRDHSTVIHAITAVNDLMYTDKKFEGKVEELKKNIQMKNV